MQIYVKNGDRILEDSSRVEGQWVKQRLTSGSMIDHSYIKQTWSSILGVNLRVWVALLPPPTRFRSASGSTELFISPFSRWNSNALDQVKQIDDLTATRCVEPE